MFFSIATAFGFNCTECAVRTYTILFIEASYTIIRFLGYYSPSAVKVRGACLVIPRCDEALIYSTIGKLRKYYKETLEQPPHALLCCLCHSSALHMVYYQVRTPVADAL